MTETQQGDTQHFTILVETAPGSETFTVREPYEGSLDQAKEYAQEIAHAEGRRVKLVTGDGEVSEILNPSGQDDG